MLAPFCFTTLKSTAWMASCMDLAPRCTILCSFSRSPAGQRGYRRRAVKTAGAPCAEVSARRRLSIGSAPRPSDGPITDLTSAAFAPKSTAGGVAASLARAAASTRSSRGDRVRSSRARAGASRPTTESKGTSLSAAKLRRSSSSQLCAPSAERVASSISSNKKEDTCPLPAARRNSPRCSPPSKYRSSPSPSSSSLCIISVANFVRQRRLSVRRVVVAECAATVVASADWLAASCSRSASWYIAMARPWHPPSSTHQLLPLRRPDVNRLFTAASSTPSEIPPRTSMI
mmetsp:Transcript_12156/g.29455  ORF Transcript_12156/g.29455 Transcript_12156/m.29455 type:complete len:288 (+) Transcript_12156:3249-4112(+)